MPRDVRVVPTQRTSGKRCLAGFGVGIGVLALVAVPVYISALLALIAFTGCVGECSEPVPFLGAQWAGIVLLLLALPILAGLIAGRVLTALGWKIALASSALISGLMLGPRIFN